MLIQEFDAFIWKHNLLMMGRMFLIMGAVKEKRQKGIGRWVRKKYDIQGV